MSHLLWVLFISIGAAIIAGIVLWARSRARRAERARDEADHLRRIEAEITALAGVNGWSLEMRPSDALWYRIRGNGGNGAAWEMVEGPPTTIFGAVAGGGLRWSTDAVRAPQLMLEVLPSALYLRMKAAAEAGEGWDASWSVAIKKLLTAGRVVPLEDPWLADRLTLVSVMPAAAQRLFSPEIQGRLAGLRSATLRIALGFPNLRLSCDEGGGTPGFLTQAAAAGAALADRYRALQREFET